MKNLILTVLILMFCASCTTVKKKEDCEGNQEPVAVIKVYDYNGDLVK